MKYLFDFLEGKKTYLVALLVGVTAVLEFYGVLEMEVAQTIFGLLGATALATLRAGVTKK
jgi:hypothetical protein